MTLRRSSVPGLLTLLLATGPFGLADQVGSGPATVAARQWLRASSSQWMGRDREVGAVRTHLDSLGRPLFHEVSLDSGGFVLMAAEDDLEPVIAFSEHGFLEVDPENPLYALVQADLMGRMAALRRAGKRDVPDGFSVRAAYVSPERMKWQALLGGNAPADTAMASIPSVTDVRVPPLVASKWNQSRVAGLNVYNYFTPNNYVCGCVATAMAQVIRYHQFPTAGIGVKPFTIYVDKVSQSASTRGGDGSGGAYGWNLMPLVPAAGITDGERQMIGALCYDAGLSVNMSYEASGSGSNMNAASRAMVKTFGYGHSVCGSTGGELTGHGLLEMVQPNLDAGFPVLFGISGNGGHAIVCDGYGFNGSPSTLYHHLNLGWGGNSDAWYNLPNIGTGYNFNLINACVYNIFPFGSGDIISGRITDASGTPVAGVQVSNGAVNATSNANGIYALVHVTPGVQTITASKAGATFPVSMRLLGPASADGATVGNLPNVDLVMGGGATPSISPQPLSQEVQPGGSVSFLAGATGAGPLHFQWLKNDQPVGTDGLTYTWNGVAASDDQSTIQVRVTGPQGVATSSPAKVSVVYLLNGGFESGSSGWGLSGSAVKSGTLYSLISPHSGEGWARLGDHGTAQSDAITQTVSLPANATGASLSFWMGIANDGASATTPANAMAVKVMDGAGTRALETLLTSDNTHAELDGNGMVVWHRYGPFDLTKYVGQRITLRFESTQAGDKGTGTIFVLDDVVLPVSFASSGSKAKAVVTPGAWTMATGGSASFSAQVTNAKDDQRVSWSVTGQGGTFQPVTTAGDGQTPTIFQAGAGPGTFTLSATPLEPGGTAGTSALTLVAPQSVSVLLSPSSTTLSPDAPVSLSASVTPLSDGRVSWTCSGGAFSTQGGTSATWSCGTPGTYTVTATATGAPTRSASATLVVSAPPSPFTLTPSAMVLLPGASATITASGADAVVWDIPAPLTHTENALRATITAPAIAPLTTRLLTLRGTSAQDASRSASAVLTLKGMDLNGDGLLDPADLLVLAAQWGKDPASPANFKGQDSVGDIDLTALLGQVN